MAEEGARPVIGIMSLTTVGTPGHVWTILISRCREYRRGRFWLCLAAHRKRPVVLGHVRPTAMSTDSAVEVTLLFSMSPHPALLALRRPCMNRRREDGTVLASQRDALVDKLCFVRPTLGVPDLEPHCAHIGTALVPRNARLATQVEVHGERVLFEASLDSIPCDRSQWLSREVGHIDNFEERSRRSELCTHFVTRMEPVGLDSCTHSVEVLLVGGDVRVEQYGVSVFHSVDNTELAVTSREAAVQECDGRLVVAREGGVHKDVDQFAGRPSSGGLGLLCRCPSIVGG
jgi:hypothetical protein